MVIISPTFPYLEIIAFTSMGQIKGHTDLDSEHQREYVFKVNL